MIDAPEIVNTQAIEIATLPLVVSRAEIQKVMGPALGELRAALDAQGVATTGPWFTHHLRLDSAMFDLEVCMPVAAPVTPTGRVVAGQLRAARVARSYYRGPFQGLPSAWGELRAWIAQQGLTCAPDIWEVYIAGPDANPDPASWVTQLNAPLLP